MLAVQEGRRHCCNKELRAVGVGAGVLFAEQILVWGKKTSMEGVRVAYSHGQQPRPVVLQGEILVGKGLGAVDAGRACAVAVEKIAALAHEAGDLKDCVSWVLLTRFLRHWVVRMAYNPVKLGALVALRPAQVVLGLARAELAKVFGCPGDDVLEEFERDASEGLAW